MVPARINTFRIVEKLVRFVYNLDCKIKLFVNLWHPNFVYYTEKKVRVAASTIHGQGLFVRESCNKSDFIIEYRGELITIDESDVRAKQNATKECTYMFQLNDEYLLDAVEFGNKARFINFSHNPNCHSKVRIVNGDHRVGIFAKRSIQAGEELTLNYLTYDPTKNSNDNNV